jgi:adenine-specific DNA-methyltransferase
MPYSRLVPKFTFTAERLEGLKAVVPEAFADGRINWEALRESLGDNLEPDEASAEHFGLFWPGKRQARRVASLPSRGTLLPAPGEGVNEDETNNLFIEGDNLEVLKLLQKAYARRVKMIYIDPPYNTGNDFVYNDNFTDSLGEYLRKTGQADEEGALTTNTRADGRFHSNWLSMIYPRLRLASAVLRDDGFLVASIDDTEMHHLRMILNEVFGEENHLATLVWDRNRKNDARFFSVGHEYMLVYAKAKDVLIERDIVLRAPKEGVEAVRNEWEGLRKMHRDDWAMVREGLKQFFDKLEPNDPIRPLGRFSKVDERGPYRDDGDASWPGGGGPRYEVLHPRTHKPCKVPQRGWVFSTKQRMDEMIAAGVVVFGADESLVPKIRSNLFEKTEQVLRSVQFSYAQTASQQFDKIFGGKKVFDNPKPFGDLAKLIDYLCGPDDLVLDFFAGSGSTGHATLLSNRVGGNARRFICVQLPERVNEKEPSGKNALSMNLATVAHIGEERLRRVIKQMRKEEKTKDGEDLGFRVLKLAQSHYKAWQEFAGGDFDQLQIVFDEAEEPLVKGWTADGLLTEVLLLEGFPLDSVVSDMPRIRGNKVQEVTSIHCAHRLLVCLDKQLKETTAEGLAYQDRDVFVCLDSALTDQAKQRLADLCTLKTI